MRFRLSLLLVCAALLFGDSFTSRPFPQKVTSATLTTTGASTGTLTVYTCQAGYYRLAIMGGVTTQGTGGTATVGGSIGVGGVLSIGITSASFNLNTLGASSQTSGTSWCAASNTITVNATFSSPTGSPVVSYVYSVEKLNN